MKKLVCVVYGTRPEAIKLAPIIEAINTTKTLKSWVVSSGQHTTMLNQAERVLKLKASTYLKVGTTNQTLPQSFSVILSKLEKLWTSRRPDLVLVQGDTTTASAAALAAFYLKIPVGHVEAGLRSGDLQSPFPEELNRILIDKVSSLLFAPTRQAATNLYREKIPRSRVFVTGNSVVDVFNRVYPPKFPFKDVVQPFILLTLHRRENFGSPMRSVCYSMLKILSCHNINLVIPVHPNPQVQKTLVAILGRHPRVHLVPPVDYPQFLDLMSKSLFVMSDSGGVQEEVTLVHKPLLVLRTNTERPEVIRCGAGRLVGTSLLVQFWANKLLRSAKLRIRMEQAKCPFGDGKTARRIAQAITTFLKSQSVALRTLKGAKVVPPPLLYKKGNI